MSAALWLAVAVAVLALCWHLGGVELRRLNMIACYGTAHLEPHAHCCADCRCGYSDQRALVWHRQAAHPNTFDFGHASHAVHRRIDDGRNSAGEILEEVNPEEAAPGASPHETEVRGRFFRGGRP